MGKKIKCLGRYGLDDKALGKGCTSRVELATHQLVGIKVAIKISDTRKLKDDYQRKHMHRESTILRQLRHPNIVRVYETLKAGSLYCVIMEFVDSGELGDYVLQQNNGRLCEKHCRPLFQQLASAVAYLHKRGVVHRDLKLSNILISSQKRLKLIDFGYSNAYSDSNRLTTRCGALEFLAPELYHENCSYGPEIDMWSCGIVFYFMLNGQLPYIMIYKDVYVRTKLIRLMHQGLAPFHEFQIQNLSSECKLLLHDLICPNPKERITSEQLLDHAWVTKNTSFQFLPRNSNPVVPMDAKYREEILEEMSEMLEVKKKQIDEVVSEYKTDDYSAIFNLIYKQKLQKLGIYDNNCLPKSNSKIIQNSDHNFKIKYKKTRNDKNANENPSDNSLGEDMASAEDYDKKKDLLSRHLRSIPPESHKESHKESRKESSTGSLLIKPPDTLFITSRPSLLGSKRGSLESPALSPLESPVISPLESPVISHLESPVISRLESPAISPVESSREFITKSSLNYPCDRLHNRRISNGVQLLPIHPSTSPDNSQSPLRHSPPPIPPSTSPPDHHPLHHPLRQPLHHRSPVEPPSYPANASCSRIHPPDCSLHDGDVTNPAKFIISKGSTPQQTTTDGSTHDPRVQSNHPYPLTSHGKQEVGGVRRTGSASSQSSSTFDPVHCDLLSKPHQTSNNHLYVDACMVSPCPDKPPSDKAQQKPITSCIKPSPRKPTIPPPDLLNLTLDLSRPDFELISRARTLGVTPNTSVRRNKAFAMLPSQPHRTIASSMSVDGIASNRNHSVTHDCINSAIPRESAAKNSLTIYHPAKVCCVTGRHIKSTTKSKDKANGNKSLLKRFVAPKASSECLTCSDQSLSIDRDQDDASTSEDLSLLGRSRLSGCQEFSHFSSEIALADVLGRTISRDVCDYPTLDANRRQIYANHRNSSYDVPPTIVCDDDADEDDHQPEHAYTALNLGPDLETSIDADRRRSSSSCSSAVLRDQQHQQRYLLAPDSPSEMKPCKSSKSQTFLKSLRQLLNMRKYISNNTKHGTELATLQTPAHKSHRYRWTMGLVENDNKINNPSLNGDGQ